jgi:hypothetical protein
MNEVSVLVLARLKYQKETVKSGTTVHQKSALPVVSCRGHHRRSFVRPYILINLRYEPVGRFSSRSHCCTASNARRYGAESQLTSRKLTVA